MRRFFRIFTFCLGVIAIAGGGAFLIVHPATPLPDHWNPIKPMRISDPVTPLTSWKLSRVGNDPEHCPAVLEDGARFDILSDFRVSDACHIETRVRTTALANVALRSTETRCDTALTTALWLEHGVQPAAQDIFGQRVASIRTQGSYNCRTIGGSSRMSTHATAAAIDVAGFTLADGTRIELLDDWGDGGPKGAFLARVRDASCDWYATTLGPDYNRAHADHFHLQTRGWGLCR